MINRLSAVLSMILLGSLCTYTHSDDLVFHLDLNDSNLVYLGSHAQSNTNLYYSRKSVRPDPGQPPNSGGLTVAMIMDHNDYKKNPAGIFYNRDIAQYSVNCSSNSYSAYKIFFLQDHRVVHEFQNPSLYWKVIDPKSSLDRIMQKMVNQICS